MKALFVPDSDSTYELELIAESTEEEEFLKSLWRPDPACRTVTCEQWRELAELQKEKES